MGTCEWYPQLRLRSGVRYAVRVLDPLISICALEQRLERKFNRGLSRRYIAKLADNGTVRYGDIYPTNDNARVVVSGEIVVSRRDARRVCPSV